MPLALLLFHEPHVYQNHFDITYDPNRIDEADLVVFPGGGDWNPSYYGKIAHPQTRWSDITDRVQMYVAREAIKQGKKMAGHCRGAQLMCILNGDPLIQHVKHHFGTHLVNTHHGNTIKVNSIHHQMMHPTKNYQLLAYSSEVLSPIHETVDEDGEVAAVPVEVEPEAVWFDDIKGLAVQWHPEWMETHSDGFKYYQDLIEEFLV